MVVMHHYVVVTDIDTPAALLREARNQLFERPWIQREIHRPDDGGICALGACLAASGHIEDLLARRDLRFDDTETVHYQAAHYLAQAAPVDRFLVLPSIQVVDYNDDPDRTFDEIIDWFDRAEKLAETDASS